MFEADIITSHTNGTVLCAIPFSFPKCLVSNLNHGAHAERNHFSSSPNVDFGEWLPATSTISHVPTGFLSYNFTLATVNVTLPNANQTRASLVLGQDGTKFPSSLVL